MKDKIIYCIIQIILWGIILGIMIFSITSTILNYNTLVGMMILEDPIFVFGLGMLFILAGCGLIILHKK